MKIYPSGWPMAQRYMLYTWLALSGCWVLSGLGGCAATSESGPGGAKGDIVTESDEPEARRRARIQLELAVGYFEQGQTTIVVGNQGWYQSGNGDNYLARWFTDSTQPASRIAFFHVALPLPHRRDVPHTHTEDELIYVMDGSIVMGKQEYTPGTCLAIPGKVHYSVTTGASGVKFLNYRRDASLQEYGKVKEPELESAIVRGGRLVGDLR